MTDARRPAILALVRHGESTWIDEGRFQGRGDPPLSAAGQRQAEAVATRLAATSRAPSVPVPDEPPLAIWHSPLERAAGTARAIHAARGGDAPLLELDDLTELGQGEWEGRPHTEVRERWPDELAAWRSDPSRYHAPGGEALPDAYERARRALKTVLGDPTDALDRSTGFAEPVLGYERLGNPAGDGPAWSIVVAHDGLLRLLAFGLLGIDVERFWSFPFALASVSVIDLTAGFVRLRAHNLDEHIAVLGR